MQVYDLNVNSQVKKKFKEILLHVKLKEAKKLNLQASKSEP